MHKPAAFASSYLALCPTYRAEAQQRVSGSPRVSQLSLAECSSQALKCENVLICTFWVEVQQERFAFLTGSVFSFYLPCIRAFAGVRRKGYVMCRKRLELSDRSSPYFNLFSQVTFCLECIQVSSDPIMEII